MASLARSVSGALRSQIHAPVLSSVSIRSLTTSVPVPETKETVLDNGFRVVSEDLKCDTATVGVFINAGSAHENEANNGVAHFLEHMAFKGTTSRSQTDLEKGIEQMGGHLNAFTTRENTVYHAKVMKNDIGNATEVLADILQNSTYEPSQIERERSVILSEMADVESRPEEVVFDQLHGSAFQVSSLGRTILGPRENINSISQADLKEYVSNYYTANNMLLAAAGGVDHDALVGYAKKHFSNLKPSDSSNAQEKARFIGSDVRIENSDLTQLHVAVAVEGAPSNSDDAIVLQLMSTILGSWDKYNAGSNLGSSQLSQAISEHNLADQFMSFSNSYRDTGLFGCYAVAEPGEHVDDMIFAIENEWVKMCYSVSAGEIQRAKSQMKANLLMGADGTDAVCEDLGTQSLITGKKIHLNEMFNKIDRIQEADIKRVANEYIFDKDPVLAALGPQMQYVPDYSRLRRWTYWIRA